MHTSVRELFNSKCERLAVVASLFLHLENVHEIDSISNPDKSYLLNVECKMLNVELLEEGLQRFSYTDFTFYVLHFTFRKGDD